MTKIIVLTLGLFSLMVYLVAFSRPPLEQSSGAHYLSVIVFYAMLVGFWSLLSIGVIRLGSYSRLGVGSFITLVKAPVLASLAFGLALLLTLFSFGTETEIGYALAVLFLLVGFCFATAILASHWAGSMKAPVWMAMGIAGFGGPIGLLISAWLTVVLFGEDFLVYDVMMFL